MMSPDTMTSTQGDSQDMNNMDTSESSLPIDDVSSSAEDKLRRRNPFVQSDDDDDDECGKPGGIKDSPETTVEKSINDKSSEKRVEAECHSQKTQCDTNPCSHSVMHPVIL